MSITVINLLVIIMFAHFVADFMFQNEYMAKNKSNSLMPLIIHGCTYTTVFFIIVYTLSNLSLISVLFYSLINGIIHTVVDYFTSKLSAYQHRMNRLGSKSVPNFGFFTVIGFDQFLHAVFLLYTLKFIL